MKNVHKNYGFFETLQNYYASRWDFLYIKDLCLKEFLNDFKLLDNLTKTMKKINFNNATIKQIQQSGTQVGYCLCYKC